MKINSALSCNFQGASSSRGCHKGEVRGQEGGKEGREEALHTSQSRPLYPCPNLWRQHWRTPQKGPGIYITLGSLPFTRSALQNEFSPQAGGHFGQSAFFQFWLF